MRLFFKANAAIYYKRLRNAKGKGPHRADVIKALSLEEGNPSKENPRKRKGKRKTDERLDRQAAEQILKGLATRKQTKKKR